MSQVLSCLLTNEIGTYLVDIVSIFRYLSFILWVNCIGLVSSPLCFQGFPQIPVEFLDRFPAIICPDFFLVGPSPQYYVLSFLESLESVAFPFKFFCAIACFDCLDTLLPAALCGLNSEIKSQRIFISALGSGPSDPPYLSLLRHGQSQFCKNFASFFFST